MNDKYKDMLHMPHPVSNSHPRMSLQERAAQFSPFAALTGYEEALQETARQTDHFIELDEDRKQEIDRQLSYLIRHLREFPVKITYFIPDLKKEGGKYYTVEGYIRKIDGNRRMVRVDDTDIPVEKIYEIEFERTISSDIVYK